MQIEFKKSFQKDLTKITDRQTLSKIKKVIEEVQQAQSLQDVSQIKKLRLCHGMGIRRLCRPLRKGRQNRRVRQID